MSLRASVFVLALLCVLAAQAISFAILLIFPAQAPPPVIPADVAAAFRSPASSGPGPNGLRLHWQRTAPFVQDEKPYARLVARTLLAALTDAGVREVRVRSLSDAVSIRTDGVPPAVVAASRRGGTGNLADPLTAPFPSFASALLRGDGQWLVVEPGPSAAPPGYWRIASAFALSGLLLAPLAWWTSRRMTRPLQLLADASRTLGRDPGAAPLPIAGPPEVRAAAAAFNAMQTELARHMDERATLMAAIAHDLRTPLTSLRLRAEAAPDPQRGRMAADIARMEVLIADLLLFVRGARATARREYVDLATIAEVAAGTQLTGVRPSAPNATQVMVLVDASAVQRALDNLVSNAVDHAGGAKIAVGVREGWACIEVTDEGPGIPEDALDRVFEPFVRLETSRSRKTGGVGLGLAIARGIARAHGGDVELLSRSGRGLIARLRLPLQPQT